MIAEFISSSSKIRLGRQAAVVGLAAFSLLAAAFLAVAYFAHQYAFVAPPAAGVAVFAMTLYGSSLVGLFFAAAFTLGLTGIALTRQGSGAPLGDLRACLIEAFRDPINAGKLALPAKQDGELGEVIAAANDLFAQISTFHREAFDSLETLSSHLPGAIIAYDAAGQLLYANSECVNLCGFDTFEELQGADEFPRFEVAPDSPPVALTDCLSQGSFSKDVVLLGYEGRKESVHLNAACLPVSPQSPTRFYAIITEAAVQREVQPPPEQENVQPNNADQAHPEFMANLNHDLRTPLNDIIGYAEIMKNQAFGPIGSPKYLEYLEHIHKSGNNLVRFIDNSLDLSEIETERLELNETKLPLRTLIESCVHALHEKATNAGINLSASVPENLPDLHADERLVKQMLMNLASNGLKFTPAGGTVTIGAQNKGGALLVGVADTGIGMNQEEALIALQPFRQVDGSPTQHVEGSGLGLPLVKSYIELHGGGFRLDSGPGKGTLVTLTFPPERTLAHDAAQSVA